LVEACQKASQGPQIAHWIGRTSLLSNICFYLFL